MGASSVDVDSLLHAVMCLLLGYCWLEVGAFVGTMPEGGGLTRSSIRAEQLLDTEDAGAGWLATERFLVELDFLLRGATTRESNDA